MPSSRAARPSTSRTSSRSPRLAVAILAAGKGTRLKSKHPKVLHQIGGKPLLAHVIAAAQKLARAADIYVIIGHEAERVREAVSSTGAHFVLQAEQRGTGHALMSARKQLAGYDHVLVLSGDVPLIRPETLQALYSSHLAGRSAMSILTTEPADPTGYGRIVRKSGRSSEVAAIVEQKSANARQAKLREINSGIYVFQVKPLLGNIDRLSTDNPHGEFYLTDMAMWLGRARMKVTAVLCPDAQEVLGVNTRAELAALDAVVRSRKCTELMSSGVTIYRPETCVVDSDVTVGEDTIIEPFVQLLGRTQVGADCHLHSYSVVSDCVLADSVTLLPGCVLEESRIETEAVLGPYARLRPGSEVGARARVGNFVEMKKSRLGPGSKAPHLTYLGDTSVGANVNVGAGTITCNYDGAQKHATVIEDGVFVGSDSTLVAPLTVGKGAYVGAGSCITDDVPADALALGRARQIVKEGWARARRESRAAARKGH